MNRSVASAAVGVAAFVVAAGAFAGGYALRGTSTTVRTVTVTRTATATVTAKPQPAATRTVKVTVTASPSGGFSTTPCVEQGGTVVPAVGSAAGGSVINCTMQILPDVPAANGDQLVITAPDGTSDSYQLGSPSGG